jgi:predicted kinase
MAHLIIIRGLPGSGKSTLAKEFGYNHFEADQYFTDLEGNYNFDATKIREAHRQCRNLVFNALQVGQNTVVSNTFTQLWEMDEYLNFCEEFGHKVTVIKCEGNYGSIHNVPEDIVAKMAERWEDYY